MLEYSDAINVVKRSMGCLFAILLHSTYGDTKVEVEQEGTGKKLAFAATVQWLDANQCSRFDITAEKLAWAIIMVKKCSCPRCDDVQQRIRAIEQLCCANKFEPGKIWEGKKLAEMVFFFEWFLKDRDFWIWPDAVRAKATITTGEYHALLNKFHELKLGEFAQITPAAGDGENEIVVTIHAREKGILRLADKSGILDRLGSVAKKFQIEIE